MAAASSSSASAAPEIISNYPFIPEDKVVNDLVLIISVLGGNDKVNEPTREQYNKALLAASLAISRFESLSESLRLQFTEVPKLLKDPKVIELLPDDRVKSELYNRTTEIFSVLFNRSIKRVKPPLEKPDASKVTSFTRLFIKDYIQSPQFTASLWPVYETSGRLCDDFERTFPDVLAEYFTCPSQTITAHTRTMMTGILGQVRLFLKDLTLAEAALKKKGIPVGQLPIKEEERLLVREWNRLLSERGQPPIIPNDLNKKRICNNLLDKIQEALDKTIVDRDLDPGAKAAIRFSKTLISPFVLLLVHWVFSPYSVAILVNRLMEWEPPSADGTTEEAPESSGPVDKAFCSDVGNACIGLIEELFTFGKASGTLGCLVSPIMYGLSCYKDDIGKQVHDLFTSIFQDNYLIKGLILADSILYDHSGVSPRPTMVGMHQLSDEEKLAFQEAVRGKISGKLYPFLTESLKSASSPGAWAAKLPSVQEFCDRLTVSLYRVGQQEHLLQIFFHYLAEGYCKAF